MALPPNFDEPAFSAMRRLDAAVDRGQARVFRVLWFWLPPGSVARDLQFQQLLASRFLSDIALQALLYGTLIATARAGGSATDAALLGTAYLLPGALLGMFGGIVADALPKRVALGGAYLLMGAIAILVPTVLGTDFFALLLVLLGVRTLHQVSQPSEASALPLVASEGELASATSFLSLASSAGEVVGKAVIAPVLVRAYGVDPVTVVAGFLLLLSSTRVLNLNPTRLVQPEDVRMQRVPTVSVMRWILGQRVMLWMLLLGGLAATVSQVLGVLGPQYTRDVLNVDPANALYVFAPAVVGLIAALAIAPAAMRRFGERKVAMAGFSVQAVFMVLLGLVDVVHDHFGWIALIDIPLVPRRVEIAAQLSMFLGFGITLAAASVQTFIARRVPLGIQGRTSALLGTLKDGMAIITLLLLGVLADRVGVRVVMTLSPVVLLALAFGMDRFAGRWRTPPLPDSVVTRRWRRPWRRR